MSTYMYLENKKFQKKTVSLSINKFITFYPLKVVNWGTMLQIVLSWFISPAFSGIASALIFLIIKKFILLKENPLVAGLMLLPAIYATTIFINFGGIIQQAPPLLGLDLVPTYGKIILCISVPIIVYMCVRFALVPYLQKKLASEKVVKIEEVNILFKILTVIKNR